MGHLSSVPPFIFTCRYFFFRLLEIRSRLYELLTHCIPPDIILKVRYHGCELEIIFTLVRKIILLSSVLHTYYTAHMYIHKQLCIVLPYKPCEY